MLAELRRIDRTVANCINEYLCNDGFVVILIPWRVFMTTERNLLGPISNTSWKGSVMSELRAKTHSHMLSGNEA